MFVIFCRLLLVECLLFCVLFLVVVSCFLLLIVDNCLLCVFICSCWCLMFVEHGGLFVVCWRAGLLFVVGCLWFVVGCCLVSLLFVVCRVLHCCLLIEVCYSCFVIRWLLVAVC